MRLDSEHDFRLPLLRCGANSYFHTEGVDGVGKGALSPPYRHASCLTSGSRKSEFQFSFSAEAGAGKDEEPLRTFCAVERGKPTQGAQPSSRSVGVLAGRQASHRLNLAGTRLHSLSTV